MHESGASLYLRRFRFGGEKGAAGVCRGCGEPMEIQSKRACNQLFSKKQRLPMKRSLQAHAPQLWHNRASAAPAASFSPVTQEQAHSILNALSLGAVETIWPEVSYPPHQLFAIPNKHLSASPSATLSPAPGQHCLHLHWTGWPLRSSSPFASAFFSFFSLQSAWPSS